MSFVFKIFGSACVLFAAALISRKYSEHLAYRTELTRSFCELLLHIKNKISVYLALPSELVSGFSSEALLKSGYLPLARELGSPKEAYFSLSEALPLTPESKRILDTYFDSFGVAYKDELIKATEIAETSLKDVAKREQEALPRDKKLGRTVIFAVALGIVILFI